MEIADYIVAEDRRLVELVLEGDDTAFEYLFNRYRDAIHRLFVQRLGGVNDADDLLQETFIKVYINLHRASTWGSCSSGRMVPFAKIKTLPPFPKSGRPRRHRSGCR